MQHKKKKWLRPDEVQAMLDLAKSRSKRDFLLLSLMRWGFRCGEIVGWKGLPGIRPADIRTATIWIRGKGFAGGYVRETEQPVDLQVLELLRNYVSDNKIAADQRVFPISEPWAEELTKWYAQHANLEDWQRITPHRLRAFFATDAKEREEDAFTIRDLMRHRKIETTNLYVGVSSTQRLVRVMKRLGEKENVEPEETTGSN